MMMVLFQRKIIYMGYIPPGSRTEILDDGDPDMRGLVKEDVAIESQNGVTLRGYLFKRRQTTISAQTPRKAIVVYFQGNVGSPIHRLPLFRKLLTHPLLDAQHPTTLEILAVPPRSFGRSTNQPPTQRGILRDYTAVTQYASHQAKTTDAAVIWMGHSLGASVATVLLDHEPPNTRCDALIFENGFASIPEMVRALYPSKWVPYHYLGRLALDIWDARGVFERGALGKVPVLFVSSDDDELVPPAMMHGLYEAARSRDASGEGGRLSRGVTWVGVKGGLHDFAWKKEAWGKSVVRFVKDVADTRKEEHG
ncbi:hypothetical protein NliqN6_4420 [Naganishia liquefaciens]|uniref:Alpha/beta hydrolase n=1 Tax=Naganishia liquefaciens TaxID=104408 RepID=A0A8H3TVT0_9TREE|nr:hypothetical protein NliqN6_4420 [Naganishia liquefaciens]